MRNFLLFVLLLVLTTVSYSQDLIVKAGAKGLFLEHKVGAKESIYSIGRQFHVHPKFLAAYNKLDISQGLNLGQLVNIPLSDTNLNRNSSDGQPVFYQSTLKQTTGSISALSKTPSSNIRKWNNLTDDNIPPATKIIIGYIMPGESSVATEVQKEGQPVSSSSSTDKKPAITAVQEKKEEVKGDTGLKTAVVKEDVKPKEEAGNQALQTTTIPDEGEGFFKTNFAQQLKVFPLSKDETVTGGIFKTTSGWNDAKFYALIDGIEPGTIIRVINPENNKVVFAKVLGQMSGIRQNEGYNLRISSAAAAALQLSETDKFIVKVNY